MQIVLRAEPTQDAHNRHSAKERLKTKPAQTTNSSTVQSTEFGDHLNHRRRGCTAKRALRLDGVASRQ